MIVREMEGVWGYQLFAIPQKPDRRAAYGRQDRGHLDRGGTVLAWMVVSESDDDIVLPVRYGFGFCLEFTNMIGGTGRYGEFGDRTWRNATKWYRWRLRA